MNLYTQIDAMSIGSTDEEFEAARRVWNAAWVAAVETGASRPEKCADAMEFVFWIALAHERGNIIHF